MARVVGADMKKRVYLRSIIPPTGTGEGTTSSFDEHTRRHPKQRTIPSSVDGTHRETRVHVFHPQQWTASTVHRWRTAPPSGDSYTRTWCSSYRSNREYQMVGNNGCNLISVFTQMFGSSGGLAIPSPPSSSTTCVCPNVAPYILATHNSC